MLEENSTTVLPSPLLSPPKVSNIKNQNAKDLMITITPSQLGEAGRGLIWSHSGLYSLHTLVEDDTGLWWENEVIIIMLTMYMKI